MMHGLFIPVPNHELNLAPLKNVPGASSAGSVRVVSGSGFRYVVPFPFRLHEMLCNVESKNNGSVVSWLPDGNHFKVHDPRRFVEVVIPSAFKQKSLKSFQRQLHLYGFQRVHEGPDKGAYFHEKFLRNDRDLSLTISRTKAPKRSRVVPTKNDDPNKKSFSFKTRKRNIDSNTVNNDGGGESQSQQSSHLVSANNSFTMKRPLHNPTSNSNNINGVNSLASPSKIGSSSGLTFGSARGLHHEESIADTCEWLIKNGVPISAFDPVAIAFDPVTIDDISNSTCNVPRSANAGCDITSLFSGGSPNSNNRMEMMTTSRSSINEDYNRSSSIMTNTQQTTPLEVRSLDPVSVSPSFPESHFNISYSTTDSREEYPLRTDLLPGEMLPSIDDVLWAL